jgi:hypothetical protein
MKYRCISADSHLEIRPDRYTKRVPAKYRDRAPKVIVLEDGSLAVLQEGQPLERLISNISCGLPYEERRPFDPAPGENYENSPGTGSPESSRHSGGKIGPEAACLHGRDPRKHKRRDWSCQSLDPAKAGSVKKMITGVFHGMAHARTHRQEAIALVMSKWKLDRDIAEKAFDLMIKTWSENGLASDQAVQLGIEESLKVSSSKHRFRSRESLISAWHVRCFAS